MFKINTKAFDPANLPEGVWATYAQGIEIKVRKINSDILRELCRPYLNTVMEVDKSTGRMAPVEKMEKENSARFNDALIDFLIEDQKGFGDQDRKSLPKPLDLASKKFMMREISISDFVWNFSQSLEVITDKQA